MATDTQIAHPKPLSQFRISTTADGRVEVTLSGNGGYFLLSHDEEGPYVVMTNRWGNTVENAGSFRLTAAGHFKGYWHETDPENPRKTYYTSFPILQHIPIIDRLKELRSKATTERKRRKKAMKKGGHRHG